MFPEFQQEVKKKGSSAGAGGRTKKAGNPSEKEAPRKVQSHVGDRMEELEGVSRGAEWGEGQGGETEGAMQTDWGMRGGGVGR